MNLDIFRGENLLLWTITFYVTAGVLFTAFLLVLFRLLGLFRMKRILKAKSIYKVLVNLLVMVVVLNFFLFFLNLVFWIVLVYDIWVFKPNPYFPSFVTDPRLASTVFRFLMESLKSLILSIACYLLVRHLENLVLFGGNEQN